MGYNGIFEIVEQYVLHHRDAARNIHESAKYNDGFSFLSSRFVTNDWFSANINRKASISNLNLGVFFAITTINTFLTLTPTVSLTLQHSDSFDHHKPHPRKLTPKTTYIPIS